VRLVALNAGRLVLLGLSSGGGGRGGFHRGGAALLLVLQFQALFLVCRVNLLEEGHLGQYVYIRKETSLNKKEHCLNLNEEEK
jgi:hypothetical protein